MSSQNHLAQNLNEKLVQRLHKNEPLAVGNPALFRNSREHFGIAKGVWVGK